MDTTQNPPTTEEPKQFQSFPQQIGQKVANKISSGFKTFKTFKKIGTIWAFLISPPGIVLITVLFIGVLIGGAIIYVSKDKVDLAVQCQILGKPTDQSCLDAISDKVQQQVAPSSDEKGGINNPQETFPRT